MKIMVVDDNDRYAQNLTAFFKPKGFEVARAYDAGQGWQMFQADDSYHSIISDITMETQTSGLFLVRKIYKAGYRGNLIIATTGFDFPGVMTAGYYLLPSFAGIGWMVPKKPLKKGMVLFQSTYLKKGFEYESTLKGTGEAK